MGGVTVVDMQASLMRVQKGLKERQYYFRTRKEDILRKNQSHLYHDHGRVEERGARGGRR